MTSSSAFAVQLDQNPYLSPGSAEVDAVVTVSAAEQPGQPEKSTDDSLAGSSVDTALEVIVIDCSGSMQGEKIASARQATAVAINQLRDGVSFAVLAGTAKATPIYPESGHTAVADANTRAEASARVAALEAGGQTAIGRWLSAVARLANAHRGRLKHAILLTDGRNGEQAGVLADMLSGLSGSFSCDCRGVGTDWLVSELRLIADALLGTVDIVAEPSELAADFRAILASTMAKHTADVALRLWTPRGARIRFVKQVAPTVLDLTDRRTESGPQRGDYPLGAWGAEARDYHIGITVTPSNVGDEMLAGRVQIVRGQAGSSLGEELFGQGLIKAIWTEEAALSSRISQGVAHYTGQAELAEAIQEGLAARKSGDEATATARLGRAVALAHKSGNENTAQLLTKVVTVLDAPTGTVRLRKQVTDADEMTLDTRSTRTARFRTQDPLAGPSGETES